VDNRLLVGLNTNDCVYILLYKQKLSKKYDQLPQVNITHLLIAHECCLLLLQQPMIHQPPLLTVQLPKQSLDNWSPPDTSTNVPKQQTGHAFDSALSLTYHSLQTFWLCLAICLLGSPKANLLCTIFFQCNTWSKRRFAAGSFCNRLPLPLGSQLAGKNFCTKLGGSISKCTTTHISSVFCRSRATT
jgi:hypothetical protein